MEKELSERKKKILKAIVELYVKTAEPVGSKAIAAAMDSKVSSATIRNEMAELEEMGYLEKPHTSAGRIPSPKCYRIYVNELMEQHPFPCRKRRASIKRCILSCGSWTGCCPRRGRWYPILQIIRYIP